MEKLVPRVESLKDRRFDRSERRFRPAGDKQALGAMRSYVDLGVEEGAKLVVDGRGFRMQGYEDGFYLGGCLFGNVTPDMRIYKEIFRAGSLSVVRAHDFKGSGAPPPSNMNMATASYLHP